MQDLGLDSLDHVEVIMAMEDEFGKYQDKNDINCNLHNIICTVCIITPLIHSTIQSLL